MSIAKRLLPLTLLLPFLSHAQLRTGSGVGLEIPAPAAPIHGHFLTGAYVSGSYAPVLATGVMGYAVQPYLRYVVSSASRARLFVQYNLAPFWVQRGYGSAASPFGAGGVELPANPGFAPLAMRQSGYQGYNGMYGGLGAFSVGVPMRVGSGSVLLNVSGNVLGGLLR